MNVHFPLGLAFLAVAATACMGADSVQWKERPPTNHRNSHYPGNRPPLTPSPFIKLPIGSIHPQGWLRQELLMQRDGFHGHLGEISRFLKKENNAWLSPTGEGEHGWEEVPYWLKGYANLAFILGDEKMLSEATLWLEAAMDSQREDGWFGPRSNLTRTRRKNAAGKPDLWPNMIMLFCLQDYYDYSGDARVIELMRRYFRWELNLPDEDFLPPYWQQVRAGDNLFSVLWLYNRTGDAWLLELARKIHKHTIPWGQDVVNWHNVNMSQAFGEPATFYQVSHRPEHLQAAYRNYDKIRAMYGQVPGGMFGGDENCRPGFTDPRQAIETCGIVEMMLSHETLTTISGDPLWADRCEDVAYNSLPAALSPDLKALRYLTAPNMVLSDARNKSPGLQNGGPMLWMNPHIHRCCQHNWGHGWPYFAEHLWCATPDNGLAALFFSDCTVRAKVGDGVEVGIEESTHYPFDETVTLTVNAPSPVAFPLYLRIPAWCERPEVRLNGTTQAVTDRSGGYLVLNRQWHAGDRVALRLPMRIRLRVWAENHGAVSVDRGPLTYSLRIVEKWIRTGGTDRWPAFEIHPESPWNYGLEVDLDNPQTSFQVVQRPWLANNRPWSQDTIPVVLRARGRQIPQWKMDRLGLVGLLHDSPVRSDEPVETITLIPMGAARLRISAFPVVGNGPDAKPWPEPPKPLYKASASHCWQGDTVEAMADGLLPKNSNDHSIPRMTFWSHRGTKEWVQAEFDEARQVSRVQVYWFDDTGRGQCRVPVSWRVLYRRGGEWQPVSSPTAAGVARDRFNELRFDPVTTDALRLVVQLQPDFSAGILEWRVPDDE